jgi:hypothetical protein
MALQSRALVAFFLARVTPSSSGGGKFSGAAGF